MTRHSFIQMSKLSNVRGRISYITSHAKQENLYAVYRTAGAGHSFWSNYASKTPDWIGAPVGTQRSGSDGERTSSEMSELSPQGGSKGYGTCEDDWNPLFVEALQKQDYVDYLLDTLLSPDMEERAALIASYGKEVRTIERRMAELEAGAAAGCDGRHTRSAAAPEH